MGCNSLTYLPIAFRDYQYKKYREALGNKIIKYLRENRTSSKKHQFKFWCFFLFQERLKHWAKRIFANICSVTPKPRAEGSSPSAPATHFLASESDFRSLFLLTDTRKDTTLQANCFPYHTKLIALLSVSIVSDFALRRLFM